MRFFVVLWKYMIVLGIEKLVCDDVYLVNNLLANGGHVNNCELFHFTAERC